MYMHSFDKPKTFYSADFTGIIFVCKPKRKNEHSDHEMYNKLLYIQEQY